MHACSSSVVHNASLSVCVHTHCAAQLLLLLLLLLRLLLMLLLLLMFFPLLPVGPLCSLNLLLHVVATVPCCVSHCTMP